MACVLALVPDLLFGSRVQAALTGAGHEVELLTDESQLRELLADAIAAGQAGARDLPGRPPAALVVDLTNDDLDGPGLVESLSGEGSLSQTCTLGFYAHVDVTVRERAERAGFDQVVPRSRMAREGPQLLERLIAG